MVATADLWALAGGDSTIHACAPDGGTGLMPCCGMTPFEVSRFDRMTLDPALVTCQGVTPDD